MCALRYIDSWDHYRTVDLAEKWTTVTFSPTIVPGAGRRGTQSMQMSSQAHVTQLFDAQGTWIVGLSVRITTRPAANMAIVQLLDGVTPQLDLCLGPVGPIVVTRNGPVLGTSTYVFPMNTYVYLEFLGTIDATNGIARVRADGVEILTLTGVNTQAAATPTANQVRIGLIRDPVGFVDFDDLYICDGTGAAPHNAFLGDCRVDVLHPNGEGSPIAWTPSTGTAHYALVDEALPNDDTDYLSTLTAGAREMHQMEDLPAMPTPIVWGAQHLSSARKEDAGLATLTNVITSGAVTQLSATSHPLTTDYFYYREMYAVDPNTGALWATAGINAVVLGVEKG